MSKVRKSTVHTLKNSTPKKGHHLLAALALAALVLGGSKPSFALGGGIATTSGLKYAPHSDVPDLEALDAPSQTDLAAFGEAQQSLTQDSSQLHLAYRCDLYHPEQNAWETFEGRKQILACPPAYPGSVTSYHLGDEACDSSAVLIGTPSDGRRVLLQMNGTRVRDLFRVTNLLLIQQAASSPSAQNLTMGVHSVLVQMNAEGPAFVQGSGLPMCDFWIRETGASQTGPISPQK